MNLKFSSVLFGLSVLLFLQGSPLTAQQIPASDLPPPGTDTGLEGKYDPQNGIAQLIRDKSAESAASKIFEDEHVLVFMPLPQETWAGPGTGWGAPKRMGGRKKLDSSPTECRGLMAAGKKVGTSQRRGLGAPGL